MESLERLQSLHQDLKTFTTTRLVNIERLWLELEASIQDFRQLLDAPTQDSIRTDSLGSKKIVIDGDEYAVNDELIHLARAVGTALKLSEEEAVRVIIETQGTEIQLDPSLIRDVVTNYHDRRDFLLQDLRIILKEAVDRVDDDTWQDRFHDAVQVILDVKDGPRNNGSAFAQKCIKAMEDIESRQTKVVSDIQGKQNINTTYEAELYDTLEFQKASLFKQHEALAAILTHLFKGNFTTSEDLRKLVTIPKRWNRLDFYLIHYLPAFSAAFRQYGSPDQSSSKDDASSIGRSLARAELTGERAIMQPFEAVLSLWWVTEYSGWFRDPTEVTGADARIQTVKAALEDNALEFLLSLCASMKIDVWRHPARQEMVGLLLSETSGLSLEEEQTSDFFGLLFMECLETFAESWITNMPDSIRQLKNEEDEQRLLQITALQRGLDLGATEEPAGRLHLECLLVLISFAFENRPLPAEELFWQDPDGNLFGFVQWASKRQTVPRVGAFCEMLCSISEGPVCAAAAHAFLLEDSASTTSSRGRRIPSMNYAQMFAEIALYARKVHERPTTTQLPHLRKILPTDMNELESPVMLSCYLRLIAHMCRQTSLTRELVFGNASNDLIQNLLMLSSGPVPGYLRGSIFQTLSALLTDKTSDINFAMWKTIDNWAASGQTSFTSAGVKADQPVPPSLRVLQNTLISISDSFEQSDAFLLLLCDLMAPSPDDPTDGPVLPFPTDLGASYRPPGISPYVDFVLGQLFVKRVPELLDTSQARPLLLHSLDFIVASLSSFNENYVAVVDRPSSTNTISTSDGAVSASTYARTHPFARTMMWLFSNEASKALLVTTHQKIDEVASAQMESPLILALERGMDVINLILDLQPTYIDIVRPLVSDFDRDTLVPPSAITAFEETISARPELIHDLCNYAASDNHALVFRALNLLDSLSRSKKLHGAFTKASTSTVKINRVIDMLGPNANADLLPICYALTSHLNFDVRELEEESDSSGYTIKDTILSFFNRCLAADPDLPNIAHLLLGYTRIGQRLDIAPESMLEDGISVFNAVLSLALDYPIGDNVSDTWSWLLHLKTACIEVLQKLWSAPISAAITITQLRKFKFMSRQLGGQVIVNRATLWDGCNISEPSFWFGTAAEGLLEFLEHRACLYDYAATEIRDISTSNSTNLQKQWLSTLLGKSTTLEGAQMTHINVYELFDFLDLDVTIDLTMPTLKYLAQVKFEAYMSESSDDSPTLYDIDAIREVIRYHITQLTSSSQKRPSVDEEVEIESEANYIVAVLMAKNRHFQVQQARGAALHNLVEVVVLALGRCPMEPAAKIQFILQMLQIVLPKLDAFILNDVEDSIKLARAADALLLSLTQVPPKQLQGRIENSIADRLFQLFRICIEGVNMPDSSPALRTLLYSISSQYLTRIVGDSETSRRARRNSLDCARSAGLRLINTLSDDAEDGLDTCKPAALNLLSLLVSLARSEKSPFMIDSLVRANALELLVDPIKSVAAEFQEAVPAARKYLLMVLEERMLLLLQISRTREGAGALLDAGLLQAIRESMIFSADPDLGMDIDNAEALHNYYELVASILRVLVSTFLSRGLQNEQCQFLMRGFLQDYRPNMVGLFKRFSGVNGKAAAKSQDLLKEIVNAYVALASMSGFVEFEEEDAGGLGGGPVGVNGFS